MSVFKHSGDSILIAGASAAAAAGLYSLLSPPGVRPPAHIGADQFTSIVKEDFEGLEKGGFDTSRLYVHVKAMPEDAWEEWSCASPAPLGAKKQTHALAVPAAAFAEQTAGRTAEQTLQKLGWAPARIAEVKAAGDRVQGVVFRRVRKHFAETGNIHNSAETRATWDLVFDKVLPEAARLSALVEGGAELWAEDDATNARFVTALQVQRPLIEDVVLPATDAAQPPRVGVQAYLADPTPLNGRRALHALLSLGPGFSGEADVHLVPSVDMSERHMDWALLPFLWEGEKAETVDGDDDAKAD